MTPPRGRRPVGYLWHAGGAGWVSYTTGQPLDVARYMEGVRDRRRACDRRRYWDETTGVRQRRKVRARLERGSARRSLFGAHLKTRCGEQFGQ